MKLNHGKNITSGNLFRGIIGFTIPLFLANLMQRLFVAADTAVVGNFADGIAVASIGAGNPVVTLMIDCFVGVATGTGIVVSKAVGANDERKVKNTVDTAIVFSVVLGVFITIAGWLLSVPILKSMDCPAECFDSAVLYLKVYMLSTPACMIYNFGSAIIRAEGDSSRPLMYIIISGVVNVLTNILLCLVLTDKVAAVAAATALSKVLSAIMVMNRLSKKEGMCRFSFRKFSFHWKHLGEIMRYGIPISVSAAIYPLANLQIQPAINSYGPANLAGATASSNIDGTVNALQNAFSSSCVTYMSQNIGAHNPKRAAKTGVICIACACISGLVLGLATTHVFSEELLGVFLPNNPEAVFYGQKRMQYVTQFFWLSALVGCMSAATQALGYPACTTVQNLIAVLGFRIVWMNFVYNKAPSIDMLYVCYTISWGLTLLIGAGLFLYAYLRYRKKETLYQKDLKAHTAV